MAKNLKIFINGLAVLMFTTALLMSGCGGYGNMKTPEELANLTMEITPEEFWQRFNARVGNEKMKLQEPERTWGADQKIKVKDEKFYPQGFNDSRNPILVSIAVKCHNKLQKVRAVEISAQVKGDNDATLVAAIEMYRTALKAVNLSMSDGVIDEILTGLKANEPLPPESKDRITDVQRRPGSNGVIVNYSMLVSEVRAYDGLRTIRLEIGGAEDAAAAL